MLVTDRQIHNVAELREMIDGFEKLFGCKPLVRIAVIGPNGGSSGATDILTGEMLFFPFDGFELVYIGYKRLKLRIGDGDFASITPDDNTVIFRAKFFLP